MTGYSEGSVIGIPIEDSTFSLGVVARIGIKGVLLGYFFAHSYDHLPSASDAPALEPGNASFVARFGDLGLRDGVWPVIGEISGWTRSDWPVPNFVRHEALTGRSYRVIYGDELSARASEMLSPVEDVVGLPEDGLYGASAIEAKLAHLRRK